MHSVDVDNAALSPSLSVMLRNGTGWTYWCLGNCHTPKLTNTTPGTVLMGGGTDVDQAFDWLIKNAAGGDFLVLRADGTDAYNPYIWQLAQAARTPLNSVATLMITSRVGAQQPAVAAIVKRAAALWFAGGDQYNYVMWNNTETSKSLAQLEERGVSFGGTSAGMAVQPQFIYTAATGGIESAEALKNPYASGVTLGQYLLRQKYLTGIITDMHFVQRDRMGRTLVFVSRLLQDGNVTIGRAIMGDQVSATLVDHSNGVAKVVSNDPPGHDNVQYFLEAREKPTVCRPGMPLSIKNVHVTRVLPGDSFDLVAWRPTSVQRSLTYTINVDNGVVSSQGNGGAIY